jgi:hypothetical protein
MQKYICVMAFFTPRFVSGLWVIRGGRPGEERKIFVEEYFLSDQNSRNHDIRHWTAAKGVAAEGLADAAVVFGPVHREMRSLLAGEEVRRKPRLR